jgi:hypothetical protein
MAAKKLKRNPPSPASHKPSADLVKSVADDVAAQVAGALPHDEDIPGVTGATPHAVGAFPKIGKIDFAKLAGKLVGPILEEMSMLQDGKIDPAEIRRATELVANLVVELMRKPDAPVGPRAA